MFKNKIVLFSYNHPLNSQFLETIDQEIKKYDNYKLLNIIVASFGRARLQKYP